MKTAAFVCCLLIWMTCLLMPGWCAEASAETSDQIYHPLEFIPDDPALLGQGYTVAPIDFYRSMKKREAAQPIKRNRCELKLVADYEFFRVIGNDNYANAVRYLINLVERINALFTTVDWGLDANGNRLVGLGFSIKEIKIMDKPSKFPMHYNSLVSMNEAGTFSAHDILKSFSTEEGTNSTCMTVLITAKVFNNSILGVANIGGDHRERGICATTPVNNSYANTAVISVRRKSELIITRVVDLVVAHELGHALGSPHDDVNDPECFQPVAPSGRYIMHESSNTGYESNNYQFSPCSVRAIHKMLYELANRCFVEEKESLCGNGIVEPGEECDSGRYLAAEGAPDDTCCTSQCKFQPDAVCSSKNKTLHGSTEKTAHHLTRRGFFGTYFVFIIVVASLLIWCPCSYYVVYSDQRNVDTQGQTSNGDFVVVTDRKKVYR